MASTFTPPAGVTSDPDHPGHTLYPEIVATVVLSVTLTTLFTAARLIAKTAISEFHLEDYLSISTWVMFIGYAATFMLQAKAGIGRHVWDIRPEWAPRISQISWAIELMYCIITWLAKAALLFQLQRTFAPNRKGAVYIACQVLIWSNLLFYGGAFVALLVECVPQARIWNPEIETGHCINTGALLLAMGFINVISDLTILILPIWAIFHLHISLKTKLGISTVFAIGILAFVCSICRLIYTFPPLHSPDSSYLFAPVGLWSLAEITSIILCTCFPLMPRFIRVVTGRSDGTSKPSSGHSGWRRGSKIASQDTHQSPSSTMTQRMHLQSLQMGKNHSYSEDHIELMTRQSDEEIEKQNQNSYHGSRGSMLAIKKDDQRHLA